MAASAPVLHVTERRGPGEDTLMYYTVTFTANVPTKEGVDQGIEKLSIFADIGWPFVLECDLRNTQIFQQMKFAMTYAKLIGMIRNENANRCVVWLPEGEASAFRKMVESTIKFIVGALGVDCEIL